MTDDRRVDEARGLSWFDDEEPEEIPLLHYKLPGRVKTAGGFGGAALLGAAAGEVIARQTAEPEKGQALYGALTQQAIICAYHLLYHGQVRPDLLVPELHELAYHDRGPTLYRDVPAWFQTWADKVHLGEPATTTEFSVGPAIRGLPLAAWYRRRPEELVEDTILQAMVTHVDAPSIVYACAYTGALAASSVGQAGMDLVLGAAETAELAIERLDGFEGVELLEEAERIPRRLRASLRLVHRPIPELLDRFDLDDEEDVGIVGLLVGAKVRPNLHSIVEDVAVGGVAVSAVTGGVIGAKAGFDPWPWFIEGDIWFSLLGERLVLNIREYEDLPIPFAVEERLKNGPVVWSPIEGI